MGRLMVNLEIGQEVTILGHRVGAHGELDELSGEHGYLRAVTARREHGVYVPVAQVEFWNDELGKQWVPRARLVPLVETPVQRKVRRARAWLRNLSAR